MASERKNIHRNATRKGVRYAGLQASVGFGRRKYWDLVISEHNIEYNLMLQKKGIY